MFQCERCKKRGKTWNGSDPICGFDENGIFKDNWNCATLNELRNIANTKTKQLHLMDTTLAVIPSEEAEGFIILSWYKSRGRIHTGKYMFDGTDELLTLEQAEAAIAEWS